MDDKPPMKGVWSRHVTHFKFGGPNHIALLSVTPNVHVRGYMTHV